MKSTSHHIQYRSRLIVVFLICILLAGLLAFCCAFVASSNDVVTELASEERTAAIYLLALAQKTELGLEDMLSMANTETLECTPVGFEESGLSTEELSLLETQLIYTRSRGTVMTPVTYLLIDGQMVSITVHRMFSLFQTAVLRFFFSILSFLLFMTLMGLAFSNNLAKPVAVLNRAIRQVAKGDFTVRLPVRGHDERSEICANFNEMTEALAKSDTLQREFVSNVSHEFKTPIASIQGYARLLQSPDLDEKTRQEYLGIIVEESRRLSELSKNLLQLSSLEKGILGEPTVFSLDEQLRRTVVQLEPHWSNKNIDWELDLQAVNVESHQDLLSQVWINLLSNAIKFSSEGAAILVSCRDADGAVVSITDHGCGMDKATQSRIFDRFYQGDTSHSREGSGLGLCIVKQILDKLGGQIRVRSSPGEGTTFRVTIPLKLNRGGANIERNAQ